MNRLHRWYCKSDHWKRTATDKILPWALDGINLGPTLLELGPGPGITTEWLRHRVMSLECLEIDGAQAEHLQHRLARTNVNVQWGDATAMPYRNCRFASVVSFTMLHHIPTPELQDQLFRETYRVLQPGGIFAGVDSLPSILMSIFHIGDTLTVVAPDTLAPRLTAVGFTKVRIDTGTGRFRFSAIRPVNSADRVSEYISAETELCCH